MANDKLPSNQICVCFLLGACAAGCFQAEASPTQVAVSLFLTVHRRDTAEDLACRSAAKYLSTSE